MKLFSILRKDLRLLFHRRAQMAALFLLPPAFLLVIGFALGPGDGYGIRRGNQMIVLPVADYDGGPRALALLNAAGESVKLEKQYDLELVQSLQLSEDPSCAQAQASGTPTAQPTGTATAAETPVWTDRSTRGPA